MSVEILIFLVLVALFVIFVQRATAKKRSQQLEGEIQLLKEKSATDQSNFFQSIQKLQQELESLSRFKDIRDATAEADSIRATSSALKAAAEYEADKIRQFASNEANAVKEAAVREAAEIRSKSNLDAKEKRERIEELLANASRQAEKIIQEAGQSAEQIAGDAYRALKEVDRLTETATAMRNVIDGYGDRYLKPTYSLLDELAETYGFEEAGQQLRQARERSKLMVETGRAATCEYVEKNRKETAIRFVIDAFNGKVDSILTRSKADNYGTLERQIQDACALVNNNGSAFREARITEEYLQARLAELRWASSVLAIREREKEEQRAIREQIREEERARKEIERALRDAAKEEESLQRAMEKVRAQVAKASDEQRAKFEAELAILQEKLRQAEERNRRAQSMAQQTRAGHVYVISNIGSFGNNVYKVGMTRRLEPLDRVRELGDASVPFSFDVHAMIWSEDAPGLERELHRDFVRAQVNKVNPRKEFFRIGLTELRQAIESRGIETSWTVAALAQEYRESLAIEQRLLESPALAEDWVRHQADFEMEEALAEEENEVA
jgi:DNA repair exonuclease SbcCD ATPase subunit